MKKECRLKCKFGAVFFVRLNRFEYVLVSSSKVMVPISDINITHWLYFSEVNLQYYLQLVRSKIHNGFKFCEVNKQTFFLFLVGSTNSTICNWQGLKYITVLSFVR